jgi:hypothetical protein
MAGAGPTSAHQDYFQEHHRRHQPSVPQPLFFANEAISKFDQADTHTHPLRSNGIGEVTDGILDSLYLTFHASGAVQNEHHVGLPLLVQSFFFDCDMFRWPSVSAGGCAYSNESKSTFITKSGVITIGCFAFTALYH